MNEASSPARESDTGTRDDVVAAAVALGSASREKADAFLEKQAALSDRQAVLVELQAEELRRELRLHHWTLRVQHVSGILKLAFELAVAFIMLAIAALIANAIWDAAHDRGLVIEAFEVPPDLASRGLTGEVMANRLLDKLTAMQNATQSARPAQSYANNWGNDIKVQIPDTGISIGEFNRYLRAWLGHEALIAGEVWHGANGITVTARLSGGESASFSGSENSLDGLLQKAAENVYKQTQPYRYAVFLAGASHAPESNFNEARQVLTGLTLSPDAEDRAWAWLGLGNFARFHDANARRGLFYFHRALSEKPAFVVALWDSAQTEGFLGHSEALLADARAARATFGTTESKEPSLVTVAAVIDDIRIAECLGDYGAEISESERGAQLPDVLGIAETWRNDSLDAWASLHDGQAVRAALRTLPPLPPSAAKGRADHPEGVQHALNAIVTAEAKERANRAFARLRTNVALEDWRAALAQEPLAERLRILGYPGYDNRVIVATALRPWLALAKAQLGDMAGARAAIDTTPPDCYDCVRVRGMIAALARRWGAADYWFAIAAKQGASLPFAWTDWGAMLLTKGDYDGAIAKFESAHTKGPRFADPLEMWGETLMQENRSDLALAKFAEANKYAPNWGRLHLEWGKALTYLDLRAEAYQQFATAAHLDLSSSDSAALTRWRAKRV